MSRLKAALVLAVLGLLTALDCRAQQLLCPPTICSFQPWGTSTKRLEVAGIGLKIPDRLVNVTLDNFLADGDNTAVYSTANKYGAGNTWAGVFETEDVSGKGAAIGVEIDLMSRGDQGVEPWGRYGLMVALGVNQGLQVPTRIGYGIAVLPFWRDREQVSVNYGVVVGLHCAIACLAVQGGERIALEPSGEVAVKFDPEKRVIGFWLGDDLLWGVNVDTKAISN